MKRFRKPLTIILSLLPYLTVFIFALYSPSDPDLGWHLKYGEYFVQNGTVLRDNTFSTLMPDYQWANTSWLTDVISYLTFQTGGFFGLTLLGALIVTLTFFFFSRVAKLTLWDQAFLFPLLLYVVQPINAVSFRGQQLSLLLIGVLFYIISFYPKKPKVLLLTIPLFFLWSNLHGQFIFGHALFFGWIVLYLGQKFFAFLINSTPTVIPVKAIGSEAQARRAGIQSKKNSLLTGSRVPPKARLAFSGKHGMTGLRLFKMNVFRKLFEFVRNDRKEIGFLAGAFLASGFVNLLNPFGFGVQAAALSHFGSPLLKNISEYLPFDMLTQPWWNQVIVGISIVLGFIFLFFKGKLSGKIPLLGVSLVVYALSFGVRRYAWPAYYMILPMLKPLSSFLKPDSKKVTYVMTAVFLAVIFGIAFHSRYPFTQYASYNWDTYCESYSIRCSPEATEFLIKNNLTKNVFTLYSWGGWLIWNYPEVKPLIDGRMHLWKDKDGYSGFVDYYAYEQNFKDIDKSPYKIVYMSRDKPLYNRMNELVNQNRWKLAYEDEIAGIFVRNR